MNYAFFLSFALFATFIYFAEQDKNLYLLLILRYKQAEIWLRTRWLIILIHPKSPIAEFLSWRRQRRILAQFKKMQKNEPNQD